MKKRVIDNISKDNCMGWTMPSVEDSSTNQSFLQRQRSRNNSAAGAKNKLQLLEQQAFEQGLAQGLQAAEQEVAGEREKLKRALELIDNPLGLIEKHVEVEILNLVIALTRRCVLDELKDDPNKLIPIIEHVKDALGQSQGVIKLELHPDDFQHLQNLIATEQYQLQNTKLIPNEQLHRGECILSDEHAGIAATVSNIMEQLSDNFGNEGQSDNGEEHASE